VRGAIACLLFAATAGTAEPELRAVRLTTLDFRPALRVLVEPSQPPGEVVRQGDYVLIRIPGAAADPLPLPKVDPPLESLALERAEGSTLLKVKVAPEVVFEASYEPGMLTVVFGELPAPELRGPVTKDLYDKLFPTPAAPEASPEGVAGASGAPEGIRLGPATVRPYVSAAYVNADVLAFSSPVPVRDQYLQIAPGASATLPVGQAQLQAEYEPRIRFFASIPEVGQTSHFAAARLDLPIGSRTLVRISERYTRATLETTVVDPGREYFFDLSRYTYNDLSLLAHVDLGARLWAEGEGQASWSRFDDPQHAGFFDYDHRAVRGGLGYDIRSDLRATVSYSYDHMPPSPDRAIVESDAHNLIATIAGEIATLTQVSLSAGLRHQTNPLASGESRSFDGLTLGGTLRREIGHSTVAELQFNRSTDPSGYDTNAYYVNNSILASLTAPLPFESWLRAGVGVLRNDYPNVAAGLSVPRRDDIFGWSVGVGRNLGWRGFVRADYRHDRRDSNLPGYDITTSGFVIQLGLGLFGPGPQR